MHRTSKAIEKTVPARYDNLMEIEPSKTGTFVNACRKVGRYGLVQCSSGNLSWRIDEHRALLSASRSWLAELTPEQVSLCDIQKGICINGVRPTCESVFHLGILKNRPEVNVVLHFQSPCATAIACDKPEQFNFNVIIEVPVYIGQPVIVPALGPGSPELAQATIDAFAGPDTRMVIMKNHGLATVGTDFDEAIQRAVFFELACRILLTAKDSQPLDETMVQTLRNIETA